MDGMNSIRTIWVEPTVLQNGNTLQNRRFGTYCNPGF